MAKSSRLVGIIPPEVRVDAAEKFGRILEKKERKKMVYNVGDRLSVVYSTGESFTGELVSVREIPNKGTLILVNDETVGYRSMYADKVVSVIVENV
jgi:hypothetical protein